MIVFFPAAGGFAAAAGGAAMADVSAAYLSRSVAPAAPAHAAAASWSMNFSRRPITAGVTAETPERSRSSSSSSGPQICEMTGTPAVPPLPFMLCASRKAAWI